MQAQGRCGRYGRPMNDPPFHPDPLRYAYNGILPRPITWELLGDSILRELIENGLGRQEFSCLWSATKSDAKRTFAV